MAHTLDRQAALSLGSITDKTYHILNVFKKTARQIESTVEQLSPGTHSEIKSVYEDWMCYKEEDGSSASKLVELYFVQYFLEHWTMEGIFGSAERLQSVKSLEKMALKGLRDAMRTYSLGRHAARPSLDPNSSENSTIDFYQKFRPYGQLIRPEPKEESPSPTDSSSSRVSFYSVGSDMILGPMEKEKDAKLKSDR